MQANEIDQLQSSIQSGLAIGSIIVAVLAVLTVVSGLVAFVAFMRMMDNIATIRKILEDWQDERALAPATPSEHIDS
jgi:esterase/lipase